MANDRRVFVEPDNEIVWVGLETGRKSISLPLSPTEATEVLEALTVWNEIATSDDVDYGEPWLSCREKDAWYEFKEGHPRIAAACEAFVTSMILECDCGTSDKVLASSTQLQVKSLRVACLLGFTQFDWQKSDDYARRWIASQEAKDTNDE